MRMWNVNPKTLCRKHLLGEHLEIHMFVGSINKKISMKGYLEKGFLESSKSGKVDIQNSIKILTEKCQECSKKMFN